MATWPAFASPPTNLPVLPLRPIKVPFELKARHDANVDLPLAIADPLNALTWDPAQSPRCARDPLRSTPNRLQPRR
ncbi:MAG: hypothetical protein MUO23_15065, partial [Anaerolineales bacterium]|nr:hypothetical protein [Anaerolineales bacterium]